MDRAGLRLYHGQPQVRTVRLAAVTADFPFSQRRPLFKWPWVKNRYHKWNPVKWKEGLKPAVPWWFNFDPYPNVLCAKPHGLFATDTFVRRWEVMPNSKHYLLGFWAAMVSPVILLQDPVLALLSLVELAVSLK